MKNKIIFSFIICLSMLATSLNSCKVSYSFTGAAPMVGVNTFSVYYIPNRARLVNPNLSQQLTDELQDKLLKQTSYDQVEDSGDLEFEGQIIDYNVRPMNIQENDMAAQTRLTISVKIKYTNNKDQDQSWEKTFNAYEDFSSEKLIEEVEEELVGEIVKKLADDIFNASIANW